MGDDPDQGRCVSCGYLSRRTYPLDENRHAKTAFTWYETPHEGRATGDLWCVVHGRDRPLERTKPACLRGVDLCAEIPVEKRGKSDAEGCQAVLTILRTDRRCSYWHKWTPGFGPKEHLEDANARASERARREWEDRQEVDRRDWQEQLAYLNEGLRRQWEKKQEGERREWELGQEKQRREYETAQSEKQRKREARFNWIAIALAGAAVLLAVAQVLTMTPEAMLYRWFAGPPTTSPPSSTRMDTATQGN